MSDIESVTTPTEAPWTLAEVSAYFREDQRTTRHRIDRGELRPFRLPGSRRLLFHAADVRSLLTPAAGEEAKAVKR